MAYDPRMHDRTPLAHLLTHVPLVRMCIYHPIRHYEKHPQGHELSTAHTENPSTFILWNVSVMLVSPRMWLAWSMIFLSPPSSPLYGSPDPHPIQSHLPTQPQTQASGPRVLISAIFFLGLVYFGAIAKALQGYRRVSGTTRDTETARETRDAIREARDREKE
ncbi:hypothetical protein BKA82DRAFT_439144 [Pisolithus tinctorius]|nr:hypothetical protein BKA82DRAFT_439144 [Pisolithus tinctorius]